MSIPAIQLRAPRRRHRLAVAALAALLAAVLLSASPSRAQQPLLASARLEPSRATVGDRITLTVAVQHEPATTIVAPETGARFGALALVEAAPPETHSLGDGLVETRLAFVLTAFQTGDLTLPALTIDYRDAQGRNGSLTTPALPLSIESVIPPGDDAGDIRDLKPQAVLSGGTPAWVWAPLVVAGFVIVTALAYALMGFGLREPEFSSPLPPPSLPPHEVARAELDRLSSLDLSRPEGMRQYYQGLASCLRRYLSERFGFPAFAMTTQELQQRMTDLGVERWPARLVGGLLQECDSVQFARYLPASERARADLTTAYEIIDLTQPRAAPDEEMEAPARP